MGDWEYRPFIVNIIQEFDDRYILVGSINDEYFQVPVTKSEKNTAMLHQLFGDKYAINTSINKEITTVWTAWEVPDNRPDDFRGFQSDDGEKFILSILYA